MARDTLDNERVTLVTRRSAVGLGADGRGPRRRRARRRRREGCRSFGCGSSTRTSSTRSSASTACAWSRPRCPDVPDPEASLRKALSDPHGQKTFILSKDLAGAAGHADAERTAGCRPDVVGERLPVRAGAHDRRRDVRGAPQRDRRTDARPPARSRRGRRTSRGTKRTQGAGRVPEPAVLYEVDGHIATVTFNRPEARNAVNPEVIVRLADAWDAIDADDDVRVAILTGTGGHFCAGADLDKLVGKLMAGGDPADEFEARIQQDYIDHLQGVPAEPSTRETACRRDRRASASPVAASCCRAATSASPGRAQSSASPKRSGACSRSPARRCVSSGRSRTRRRWRCCSPRDATPHVTRSPSD